MNENPWDSAGGGVAIVVRGGGAKSRPVTPRYSEVSDAIRSNMNAYLSGTKTTDAALSDMKSRLPPIYR